MPMWAVTLGLVVLFAAPLLGLAVWPPLSALGLVVGLFLIVGGGADGTLPRMGGGL